MAILAKRSYGKSSASHWMSRGTNRFHGRFFGVNSMIYGSVDLWLQISNRTFQIFPCLSSSRSISHWSFQASATTQHAILCNPRSQNTTLFTPPNLTCLHLAPYRQMIIHDFVTTRQNLVIVWYQGGKTLSTTHTTGFRKFAAWLLSGSHACFAIGKLQACLLQSLPCQSKTYWHCKDRRFLQSRMAEDLQCISGRVVVLRIYFCVFLFVFCSFWKHVVALRQGVWMPQVHVCPDRTDVLLRCYGSSTHASPLGPGQARGRHWRHADVYSHKIQQLQGCRHELVIQWCFTCFTLTFQHLPSSTSVWREKLGWISHEAFSLFCARYGRNHRLPGRGANPRPGLPSFMWRTLLEQDRLTLICSK